MATNGCKNFLGRLDSWIEGERPAEAKAHLRDCASCQTVIEDLSAIQIEARSWNQLESEAPERVWTALRAQLEQEGLIRAEQPEREVTPVATSPADAGWRLSCDSDSTRFCAQRPGKPTLQ
jgi:hypothetical protein